MGAPYDRVLKRCEWCGEEYNLDEFKKCPVCDQYCAECGDTVEKVAHDDKAEQQMCLNCQRIIGD